MSSEEIFGEWAKEICSEAKSRKGEILGTVGKEGFADTLYIGGGTPSVLPLSVLSQVTEACNAAFPSGHVFEEFTVEVNPEDIVEKGEGYAAGLKRTSCGRVSMGVQSFDDGILRRMNRRHDSASAKEAFRILREAGFMNISIDLIFGISGQSDEVWRSTIDQALALSPEHISAYQLSVEEGSALSRMVSRGVYSEASDEDCSRQYYILCDALSAAGYNHYEVSNFALPGCEARHNSAYWRRVPYVGLGAGAHSFDGKRRSWNSASWKGYESESEILTPEDERVETLMLSLRTAAGIDENRLRSLAESSVVERLMSDGALVREGGNVRIPENRFFVSDEIIRELV